MKRKSKKYLLVFLNILIFFTFFRYGKVKYHRDSYITKENILLLKHIKQNSVSDWRLIQTIKCEDYIWWSYPNFKQNGGFQSFSNTLDLSRNNGIPKCIIKIVGLVNGVTYFNKQIRQFVWVLTWSQQIFRYYDRYYRYLRNEKLFGRRTFLNYRHGHKLHLISCIRNRELTGARLNRNHMVF